MPAILRVQLPGEPEFDLPLGGTLAIGRTRENGLCLAGSPLVSRQHAVIRHQNGWQYQILDLGSRNGTFVDGRRVAIPVTLAHGARIRVGDYLLTFLDDAEETAAGEAAREEEAATLAGTLTPSGSEPRPVALLVCDVRGFSSMAERVPGPDLARFIGGWFRESGKLVHESAGTIDKFIGDAVLAYWGSEQTGAGDCGAAFAAGRRLLAMAAERAWPGGEPFRVAVALHYGKVTCSNVGVAADRDATVIGDAVNTVFRLEAAAKEVGRALVASADFARELPPGAPLEDLGPRSLKGKQQAVRVFGMAPTD